MSEQIRCAHLRVGYMPSQAPNASCAADQWQCLDCSERFYPAQLYPTQNERIRERLLDEFAMHALSGFLASPRAVTQDGAVWVEGKKRTIPEACFDFASGMLAEKEKRNAIRKV